MVRIVPALVLIVASIAVGDKSGNVRKQATPYLIRCDRSGTSGGAGEQGCKSKGGRKEMYGARRCIGTRAKRDVGMGGGRRDGRRYRSEATLERKIEGGRVRGRGGRMRREARAVPVRRAFYGTKRCVRRVLISHSAPHDSLSSPAGVLRGLRTCNTSTP
jgi:hypothetical protein